MKHEPFFILATELAQQNVDVLVSAAGIAAIACHRATTTIPIVSVNVPDPVGGRLVASLNRPGGNLTGLSNMAVELTMKRLELAKELIKDVTRVALLVNPADEIGSRAYIAQGATAGPGLASTLCRLKYVTLMRWKARFPRSVKTPSRQWS